MTTVSYNREKAVSYAEKWAFSRNPRYMSFDGIGGDCTSFVSQCLYAGSGVMNYTPVMIYLGKLQGSSLYLAMGKQIVWVILLYILSCIVWHKATKRLTVLGG